MEHIVAHNAQESVELICVEHTHVGACRLDVWASNSVVLAGGQLRTEGVVGGGEVDLDSQALSVSAIRELSWGSSSMRASIVGSKSLIATKIPGSDRPGRASLTPCMPCSFGRLGLPGQAQVGRSATYVE
jgi:hypothetical protein